MGLIISDPSGTPLLALGAHSPLSILVETQCSTCGGCGVIDYAVDASGEEWPVECDVCQGASVLSVCPICGVEPTVDTDLCACNTPRCETCEGTPNPAEIDSICGPCFVDGLTRADEMPPEVLALEYAFARERGWL